MLPCANTFIQPLSAKKKKKKHKLFTKFLAFSFYCFPYWNNKTQPTLCMYTLSRSLHALAVGFRLPWQSSDWHCRRLLRALFRDLSPAPEGITTTKTTPPTPDLPKLKLRKSERENRRLMQLEDRDSYKKESSRSWGEEGRKKQRGRKRRFPPVRRKKTQRPESEKLSEKQ